MHEQLQLTAEIAAFSVIMQLLAGIPAGLFLSGPRTFFVKFFDILVTLPIMFPPMGIGFLLLVLFGKYGIIGGILYRSLHVRIIFSFGGLLVAAFTAGFPFMVKSIQASIRQTGPSLAEAAATLGKSRLVALLTVTLPSARNGILTGILLSTGRATGEVGISLMLGGNIIGRTETLSLAIFNAVSEGDYHTAAMLALLLSSISLVLMVLLNRFGSD